MDQDRMLPLAKDPTEWSPLVTVGLQHPPGLMHPPPDLFKHQPPQATTLQ